MLAGGALVQQPTGHICHCLYDRASAGDEATGWPAPGVDVAVGEKPGFDGRVKDVSAQFVVGVGVKHSHRCRL